MATNERNTPRLLALLLMLSAFLFAAAPIAMPGFGGFEPDQFPIPQDNPPVQPAGYAFAIWGPIYVLILVHAVFAYMRRAEDPLWRASRRYLTMSLFLGALWLSIAMVSPVWATITIWAMLVTALAALMNTDDTRDRWLLQFPIALYAGWLTAASFVSLGLVGAGWGIVFGNVVWAWIALVALIAFATLIQTQIDRAPEFGAAIIWAIVAIAIQNWSSNWPIVAGCAVGAIIVLSTTARIAAGRRD